MLRETAASVARRARKMHIAIAIVVFLMSMLVAIAVECGGR